MAFLIILSYGVMVSECLHPPGSVMTATILILCEHFGQTQCSFGIRQNYQGVCFANSKDRLHIFSVSISPSFELVLRQYMHCKFCYKIACLE